MGACPIRWVLVALGVVAADRASKWWAQACLAPISSIELCPFFHLTYVENTGAAFGLLRDSNAFWALTTLGFLAALAVLALTPALSKRLQPPGVLVRLGLGLVVGGALGNLYDRLTLGYVVDFLDFRVWPVFNLADSAISVGSVCLALGLKSPGDPSG